jgi:hypothetical protein
VRLEDDPRWRRLNDRGYRCPCCGKSFSGIFDIVFDHPDPWPHGNREKAGAETLKAGDDLLGPDLCRLGEHRFIRCTLPIPVIGSGEVFSFGPWASAKPENFDRYVEAWRNDDWASLGGFFGWLCNELPGTGMAGDALPCDVSIGDGAQRPELRVHDGAHPLADMQREGISFDALLEIYAACGQDLRPHLADA